MVKYVSSQRLPDLGVRAARMHEETALIIHTILVMLSRRIIKFSMGEKISFAALLGSRIAGHLCLLGSMQPHKE